MSNQLHQLVKIIFKLHGEVVPLQTKSTEYVVSIHDKSIDQHISYTYQGSTVLKTDRYNFFSEVYYCIVAGLMFEYEDILIDYIEIGSKRINRADIWRIYEEFENLVSNTMEVTQSNVKANFDSIITELATRNNISIWDALVEYLSASNDEYDYADVTDMVSSNLKAKINSELISRNLIKENKTNSLF